MRYVPTESLVRGKSALALLLAAAWSFTGAPATAQTPSRLQALVNDTAAQFHLTYRHDPAERDRRFEQLRRATTAWNASSRSQSDNGRLAEWLRGAMRDSMPGSHAALAELPVFRRPAGVKESRTQPTQSSPTPVTGDRPTAQTTRAAEPPPSRAVAEPSGMPDVESVQRTIPDLPVEQLEGDPFRDDPLPDER